MRRQLSIFLLLCLSSIAIGNDQPNILWITSEDNGPELGCYGDSFAETPHIDALASRSVIYSNCWSNAPVCAPARTTIISGIYPPSTGSEHMRSMTRLPKGFQMYPEFLRKAGYYCTNNSKEDYNLEKPKNLWDESSRKAHWRNRKPGQPFFAVFNITVSHESQIRIRPHKAKHDPKSVRVPAYHPDTPEVRRDWAQYYDKVTEMDVQVGKRLQEIHDAGLEDDTIVFYYGDHGSGMPRSKRWPYNSGLHVPMIVHIPAKFAKLAPHDYRTGGRSERLVSFVDLAPTVLSLVGIRPPEYFQGHAFLGSFACDPQPYIYGFRGRMDERYDMVRSVRDHRYVYIRNFMPHKIYGQHIAYMFQTPTTQVWKQLFDEGKLSPPQTYFWQQKPIEELYDLTVDRDEVHNLADSPDHKLILDRLRLVLADQMNRIRDVGFLPEDEIHSRSVGSSPYEVGHDEKDYPFDAIVQTASLAASDDRDVVDKLSAALKHSDSAVRYWAITGLFMRGEDAVDVAATDIRKALNDQSPSVQVLAAQTLAEFGPKEDRQRNVNLLVDRADLKTNSVYVAMLALNALDSLGEQARPVLDRIRALPKQDKKLHPRMRSYVDRLITTILQNLDE